MADSLSLNEFRDLEAALQAGHGPEVLANTAIPSPLPTPVGMLRLWLLAVYRENPRPSVRYVQVSRHCLIALIAGGALLGVGAAKYALYYDGSEPVDVIKFLACLVLPQIVLLVVTLSAAIMRRVWFKSSESAKIGLLPAWIMSWIESRALTGLVKPTKVFNLKRRYRSIEVWYVLSLIQVFGVVFNISVLGTSLGLVTFTDLAFAWGSTLPVEATAVHSAAKVIGMPFTPLVPTAEAVAASRYSRLERRYLSGTLEQRGVDVAATTAWWPFLAGSLVFYGLMPRSLLALLTYGVFLYKQRRLPLQTFAIKQLLRGIYAQGQAHQQLDNLSMAIDDPTMLRPAAFVEPKASVSAGVEAAAVIIWRDAPWSDAFINETLQRLLALEPQLIVRTDGDLDGHLTAARLPAMGTIYVMVDAFETLQKALIRFLIGVRQHVAAERLIIILPLLESGAYLDFPSSADQRAYWHKATQALGDPFLGAEMGELTHA